MRANHFFFSSCSNIAGAMRLPCSPTDKEKTHFLTDFFVSHFDLNSVRFVNSCKEAYLKFYNMKKAVGIKGKQKSEMHAT